MKKLYFLFLLLIAGTLSYGQTSTQNFGTGTGSLSTASSNSTTLIPVPTSGTTYARTGTNGGSVNLSTTSNPFGATDTYVRSAAATGTSVIKFSPMIDYTTSKEFYTSFKVLFGDASVGTTADSGSWTFYQGDGTNYSDGNAVGTAQTFTGLRFTFTATGIVTLQFLSGATWGTTGLTTTEFVQGSVHSVDVIGNNKISGDITYSFNGNSGTVAVNKFDLYIDGVLVGDDLTKGALANDANIDSVTFTGISSASNVANIFVDNVVVYNSVPAVILGSVKNEISNFSLYPNPVKGGKVFINSDNTFAERSVAIYDVLGKQVVSQKGTQNSIEVSHLNKGVYIIKVEEEGKVATRKLVIE